MSTFKKSMVGRQPSKYAKKLADRLTGIKPPFEFVESKNEVIATILDTPKEVPTKDKTAIDHKIVIATVYKKLPGCLFLTAPDGSSLYMGLNVVQNSPFNYKVKKRTVMRCEVASHPNGKGPRVIKILSLEG